MITHKTEHSSIKQYVSSSLQQGTFGFLPEWIVILLREAGHEGIVLLMSLAVLNHLGDTLGHRKSLYGRLNAQLVDQPPLCQQTFVPFVHDADVLLTMAGVECCKGPATTKRTFMNLLGFEVWSMTCFRNGKT